MINLSPEDLSDLFRIINKALVSPKNILDRKGDFLEDLAKLPFIKADYWVWCKVQIINEVPSSSFRQQ